MRRGGVLPGGLRLRSPALDLLRRGAAPSTVGTLWRRPSSSLFFYGCGGGKALLPARSASSLARSASSASPGLVLPPSMPLLCADADPEVKSTPNPPSFTAMMLGFHILIVVHDWFI